jgi:signal transduction histidine kinase
MSGETILVVEDDSSLLEGVRDILLLAGYQVLVARNGLEGLAVLEKETPHLIISDIMMPGMDGYRFYATLRARNEWVHIPFIFVTAKGDKSDVRRGKQLGVDEYLVKPFDEEDLLIAVRAKLQRRAQLDAVHNYQVAGLKRSILTTLNHEFRTPLTYISTYSELLRDADPDMSADELTHLMRGIKVGSERLRRLVEDFILLVELQTGEAQQIFQRRREWMTDLAALLQTVGANYAALATARGVSLSLDVPASLPPIWADETYLRDALNRLVDNAIKFSKKEGGQVIVSARLVEGWVRIEIKDQGIGIRTGELDKIFDVFHQIDRAKMEQQGSGSGLAISREIAKVHGGTLTAKSDYGVGSTFTIDLPVATEEKT